MTTDRIQQIVSVIRDMLSRGPVSLGQVTFIGLEEARKRLGEADWRRHQVKIRDSVETVLAEHCTKADAFIRSADDQYLVVFSAISEEAAAVRAAAIANSINSVLFGEQMFDGIRVHATVTGIDELSHSTAATVNEVIEALRRKAIEHARSTGGNPDETLSLSLERAGRRAKLRRSLARPQEPPVRFLFNPYWHVPTSRVATFRCTAQKQLPRGGGTLRDYAILGRSASPGDILQFDIDVLEEALLALTFAVRKGLRVHLVIQLHFETVASRSGQAELRDVLRPAPQPLRNLISFNLSAVPSGIPGGRLAEIGQLLHGFGTHLSVDMEPDLTVEACRDLMDKFSAAGIRFISYRMPDAADDAAVRKAAAVIRDAGLRNLGGAVRNVTRDRDIAALAAAGYEYIAGHVIGRSSEFLPEPYRTGFDADVISFPLED
jgi:hypothetical protein